MLVLRLRLLVIDLIAKVITAQNFALASGIIIMGCNWLYCCRDYGINCQSIGD
jgi:hypothetical protein